FAAIVFEFMFALSPANVAFATSSPVAENVQRACELSSSTSLCSCRNCSKACRWPNLAKPDSCSWRRRDRRLECPFGRFPLSLLPGQNRLLRILSSPIRPNHRRSCRKKCSPCHGCASFRLPLSLHHSRSRVQPGSIPSPLAPNSRHL